MSDVPMLVRSPCVKYLCLMLLCRSSHPVRFCPTLRCSRWPVFLMSNVTAASCLQFVVGRFRLGLLGQQAQNLQGKPDHVVCGGTKGKTAQVYDDDKSVL